MISQDVVRAGELANAAGRLLMDIRATASLHGEVLGRAGDLQSNDFLLARLAQLYPDDSVLSEESADNPARLRADRVWIIDPLDGTREFKTGVRSDWAVHVALWRSGMGLTVGAVALPDFDVTYVSDDSAIEPIVGLLPPRTDARLRVVVSGSRPPKFSAAVARAIGGDVIQLGSAGAKAMAVVRGEADAYVHAGGQYEWDSAAPVAVAQAKGLWCSRIDGSPLIYNQPEVWLPDLVVCRPELAESVLAAIG